MWNSSKAIQEEEHDNVPWNLKYQILSQHHLKKMFGELREGFEKVDFGDKMKALVLTGMLLLFNKYKDKLKPVIEKIDRVSRPGLRIYRSQNDLPKVMGGLGIAVVSTSKGIMSDRQARQDGYGGEVLCVVA